MGKPSCQTVMAFLTTAGVIWKPWAAVKPAMSMTWTTPHTDISSFSSKSTSDTKWVALNSSSTLVVRVSCNPVLTIITCLPCGSVFSRGRKQPISSSHDNHLSTLWIGFLKGKEAAHLEEFPHFGDVRVPVHEPLGHRGLACVEHVQLLLGSLQGELASSQKPKDVPVIEPGVDVRLFLEPLPDSLNVLLPPVRILPELLPRLLLQVWAQAAHVAVSHLI